MSQDNVPVTASTTTPESAGDPAAASTAKLIYILLDVPMMFR